jgi:hypothetical protein
MALATHSDCLPGDGPIGHGLLGRMALVAVGLVCMLSFVMMMPSTASASHHKTTHHSKSKSKSKKKPKPQHAVAKVTGGSTASLCGLLDNSAGSAKFESEIEADIESGNFAATKQLFVSLSQDMQKLAASGVFSGAPANVQAAIKTIETVVPQLNTALGNATNMQQLTAAFEAMGSTPGIAAAETTLGSYSTAHCGA